MKLHPASVPYRSLSRSMSTGSLFFFIGVITSQSGPGSALALAGLVVVGILVGIVYEVAYYKRFRYELTADTFDVRSGVLSRRDREVPLARVQNVDVSQNAVQRALGIAAVHVESAGGGETEITLQYVDEDEAERLQRRLRDGDERAAPEADRPDDETIFELQPSELAILCVFTIDPGASVLGGILVSFASGFDPVRLVPLEILDQEFPGSTLVAVGIALATFALAAWVLSAALTFNRYYGFKLTRSGDELHYERGLIQRYSGTIPLEKVQALTITESVPFRWFGYASLAVETAGYAPGQSGSRGAESAVPLAANDRVLALARTIEPFEEIDLERTPLRARERYAVRYTGAICLVLAAGYLLSRYTAVVDAWHVYAALLALVPPAAHLKWRSRGYQTGERYFLARTGFWRRTTTVVPYYRVQSIVDQRTIFQRRRNLASVTADTASSASFFGRTATAIDADDERADELRLVLAERLQERLRDRKRRRAIDSWLGPTANDGATAGDDPRSSPPGTDDTDGRDAAANERAESATDERAANATDDEPDPSERDDPSTDGGPD